MSECLTVSTVQDVAGKTCLSPTAPRLLKWDLHDWVKGGDWERISKGISGLCLAGSLRKCLGNYCKQESPYQVCRQPLMVRVLNPHFPPLCGCFLAHASVYSVERKLDGECVYKTGYSLWAREKTET